MISSPKQSDSPQLHLCSLVAPVGNANRQVATFKSSIYLTDRITASGGLSAVARRRLQNDGSNGGIESEKPDIVDSGSVISPKRGGDTEAAIPSADSKRRNHGNRKATASANHSVGSSELDSSPFYSFLALSKETPGVEESGRIENLSSGVMRISAKKGKASVVVAIY
jgi:hypothetical protein